MKKIVCLFVSGSKVKRTPIILRVVVERWVWVKTTWVIGYGRKWVGVGENDLIGLKRMKSCLGGWNGVGAGETGWVWLK